MMHFDYQSIKSKLYMESFNIDSFLWMKRIFDFNSLKFIENQRNYTLATSFEFKIA